MIIRKFSENRKTKKKKKKHRMKKIGHHKENQISFNLK